MVGWEASVLHVVEDGVGSREREAIVVMTFLLQKKGILTDALFPINNW